MYEYNVCIASLSISTERSNVLCSSCTNASGIDESGVASPCWHIENVAAWSREDLKLKPLRSHLDDMGLQYFYPAVPLRQVVEQFDSRTRLVCILFADYCICIVYEMLSNSFIGSVLTIPVLVCCN